MPANTKRTGNTDKTDKTYIKKHINKFRKTHGSTNDSAPPSDIELVRSPVDPSVGFLSGLSRYLYSFLTEPKPDPEPEVLPAPSKCYYNIFEDEVSFKRFIDSFGIDAYISDLTIGRCKSWEELKKSGIFGRYEVIPDDDNKANSIFELYDSYFPNSAGFNDAYYQILKKLCPDRFFSISSDDENTLCPRPLGYGGSFIYKLIYNNKTGVYTLHFFGFCKDSGCKNVVCMGKDGEGEVVRDISVDHSYIYREKYNECVVMAGQVSILDGIARFDNRSGHYRPDPISSDIEYVIKKIMDKVSFHCIIDGGGRKYKKHKKKRKNNKKTKRRKPRSKVRSKKSKTKRIRKIR